jgi:hypothetical protein
MVFCAGFGCSGIVFLHTLYGDVLSIPYHSPLLGNEVVV